jgi:uncharacterized protein
MVLAQTQLNSETLSAMVNEIVKAVHPERIILFGSYARGESHLNSDLDLLIVTSKPWENGYNRRKEISKVRRTLSRFRIPKDLLVYSADEIKRWSHSVNHIIAHILQEGKLLYERP